MNVSKIRRQKEATARNNARAKRSNKEQLAIIATRPGNSKRETARLNIK
jgi:hypothetical protein